MLLCQPERSKERSVCLLVRPSCEMIPPSLSPSLEETTHTEKEKGCCWCLPHTFLTTGSWPYGSLETALPYEEGGCVPLLKPCGPGICCK